MALLVDLDGTLCDDAHRRHHLQTRDFEAYHAACHLDPPHELTLRLVKEYRGEVYIATGRYSSLREVTLGWLRKHGVVPAGMYMRKRGDYRSNAQLKLEAAQHFGLLPAQGFVLAIDDNPSARAILAQHGIPAVPPPHMYLEGGENADSHGA